MKALELIKEAAAGASHKHKGGPLDIHDLALSAGVRSLVGGTLGTMPAVGGAVMLARKRKPRLAAVSLLTAAAGGLVGNILGARMGVKAYGDPRLKNYKPTFAPLIGSLAGALVPIPVVNTFTPTAGSGYGTALGAKRYLKKQGKK